MSDLSDFWGEPKRTDASSGEPVAAQPIGAALPSQYGPQRGGYGPPQPGYGPPQTGYAPPTYGYGQTSVAPPPPPLHAADSRVGGWNTAGWGDAAPVRASYSAADRETPLALVVGLAVLIVALIAGGVAGLVRPRGPSLKGLTAAQILDKSLTAARKAGTVHIVATFGDSTAPESIDISPNGGIDTSTVDGATATLIEVGGKLYLKADAAYMTGQFKAPESFAEKYGGKWLTVPTGSEDFKLAAGALTMPNIVDQLLALSGVISRSPATAAGQISLTGTVPDNEFNRDAGAGDSATLVISSKSPFLPISISFSDPDNGTTSMTFSKWGEQVTLTAPPSPLTIPAQGPLFTA